MSQILLDKIASVRRKRMGVSFALGACLIVIWATCWLSAGMVIDWWLDLPFFVRAAMLSVNLAGIGVLLWRYFIAAVIATDDDEIALQVEGFEPKFASRLISSIQLSRSETAAASPSLVAALIEQTQELAQPIDFTRIVRVNHFLGAAIGAGVMLLFSATAFTMMLPDSRDLLLRAALVPGIGVPRKTQVEVMGGDIVIARGESIMLIARAHGVVPQQGTVRLDYPSGAFQQFEMEPVKDFHGQFERTIENVQDSFYYTVSLNDGVGEKYHVRAEPRPGVSKIEFTQIYPAYTGLNPARRAPGDLSLLAGSKLSVHITASKKLKATDPANQVRLAATQVSIPLTVDINNPAQASTKDAIDLPPETSGLSVQLADEFGIRSKDSAIYRIEMMPDKPPTVRITYPTRKEELATRKATAVIGFDAADDFGLAKATLKYRTNAVDEKQIPLETGASPRNLRGYYQWQLSTLPDVSEGQIIEWWIEVQDNNNVTGPGIGASEHFQLRIVSEEEKRAELMNRLNDAMSQIRDVSENQKDLNAQLGKMILEKEGH